jgi:hypothetical protein
MKKILSLLVVLISVPTFAQNFNKVKVDSLFQVLKKQMTSLWEVLPYRKTENHLHECHREGRYGKNKKRQLLARNIVLYLKCLLSFNF